ncbi:MAG: methyltransferase [Ferruginibacter sp.]
MPNNYFQFKQFTIHQDKCAMKVCTDACAFGAYVANEIKDKNLQNILDIGTGTGLLSLLLAQKTNAAIDAVEIDVDAYQQATENKESAPWSERISIYHQDITAFNPPSKYDLIISNPPFFEEDLKSSDSRKNAAKHSTTLTIEQLLTAAGCQLKEEGVFAILLPYHRVEYFIELAATSKLYVAKKILLKQTTTHNFFRGILLLQKEKKHPLTETISIKDENNNYSPAFVSLLKDYYLNL